MKNTIDNLSERELELYKDIISLNGSIEDLNKQLLDNSIHDKYQVIHQQYLELFNTTKDDEIKIEILKRLTFLNWYSIVEPSCFTGLDNLDNKTMVDSFSILNDYIKNNKLDKEFIWMLSFYSSWEWAILTFSEKDLEALTKFVKSADTSILHIPKYQLSKRLMDNRGQMGVYWLGHSVEEKEIFSP